MNILVGLAFFAGACIAIQAAMNAQLGQLFNSSLLATSYAFFTSFLLVTVVVLYFGFTKQPMSAEGMVAQNIAVWPASEQIKQVPWYLWVSFVFSVIGVGSFYFLIPKMGVGSVMSYALTGQIIVAMLISHFGLFDSPSKVISLTKLVGAALLILGIVLINKD